MPKSAMPKRTKTRGNPSISPEKLLAGLKFVLSGTLSLTHSAYANKLAKYGGTVVYDLASTDYLISTIEEYNKKTPQILKAEANYRPIIKESFIDDVIKAGRMICATPYCICVMGRGENQDLVMEKPKIVTLINETEEQFNSMDFNLQYSLTLGGFSMTSFPQDLGANERIEIVLNTLRDEPVTSYGISWRRKGFLWGEQGSDLKESKQITVEPGKTYVIEKNNDFPELSQDQKNVISNLLREELESNTPFKEVWAAVHSKVNHDIRGKRNVKKLTDDYDHGGQRAPWSQFYKAIEPESWITEAQLKNSLKIGGDATIHIYWRALDRFPGGNADLHTLCYTIDCATTSVTLREYSNWDGEHSFRETRPKNLSARLPTSLPSLLEALQNAPFNSNCSFFDNNTMDSDEYDTEWSSQEVLVFLPRNYSEATHDYFNDDIKAKIEASKQTKRNLPDVALNKIYQEVVSPVESVCVQRLHRFCIMGSNWVDWPNTGNRQSKTNKKVTPPTHAQLQVLDASSALIGMGRVNTYTDAGDGEDPCLAAQDDQEVLRKVDAHYTCSLPYVQPFYFR